MSEPTTLEAIKTTLEALKQSEAVPMEGVWYGACRAQNLPRWNYFVFNRKKTTKSSNRLDFQTFYEIHVIHEDYIPEGYIETVVRALEARTDVTLKATSDDVVYSYTFKGGTDMVVEVATITIYRPEKR